MHVDRFNYQLPEHLIAQVPLKNRDDSRLLILNKGKNTTDIIERFRDVVSFFRPGDLLVINNSKVIPARLIGRKKYTGGKVEILLIQEERVRTWKALVKPARRIHCGDTLVFEHGILEAEVAQEGRAGERTMVFSYEGEWNDILASIGHVPLPPYIKRPLRNSERYQTVYASRPGSVAAPTAGLHFTQPLLEVIVAAGVFVAEITLHVGTATFRPFLDETIQTEPHLDPEYCDIPLAVAEAVRTARSRKGRIIAVGTTAVRTLESRALDDGTVKAGSGWTSLFISPPYQFRVVDAMITNFHLPKSTLLMLVCAFAGHETVMEAYRKAIEQEIRFYSFGDAMFII